MIVAPFPLRHYTADMNIIICGINARYSHSSLSLLCLKHAAKCEIKTIEFSINDSVCAIVRSLAQAKPDAVGFSCYIWNIEHVLKAASSLKKILPDCFILLGGPEVSYDGEELMRLRPFIDMIIRGPGEAPFSHFAERFGSGDISDTPSACIRSGGAVITTPCAPAYDLSDTPFMYGDLSALENKTIYYETSRGCPFGCSYCMSAGEEPSYLPLARIKAELEHFIKSGVMRVKLVDRTFNFPPSRSRAIIDEMIRLSEKYPDSETQLHLEITASLLDEDTLSLLRRARKGLFHLEVGIQSTNAETLAASGRRLNMQKLMEGARALCAMPNISVHADLIAGLPLESYQSFKKSFNDVYSLKPDELQLGFLKLLKGTALREAAQKYGIVYTGYPPYEVLQTSDISYDELSRLHLIENVVELLFNSRMCLNALDVIMRPFGSPFDFYETFALHLEGVGYFPRSHKTGALFEELHRFADLTGLGGDILNEALLLDWLYFAKRSAPPAFLKRYTESCDARAFLTTENILKYLPDHAGLPFRDVSRRCHIQTFAALFPGKTLLFDWGKSRDDERFCQTVPCGGDMQ